MENNKRCPFLKIQVCGYCSLFPMKKLIPVDQMKTKSLCLSADYQQCCQYTDVVKKELKKPCISDTEVKEIDIKGFVVKRDYFYHYGHTWVKKNGENRVKIGIDTFASKLLSNINNIEFISNTNMLNNGKPFAKVQCGDKTGLLISPIDGSIMGINDSVKEDVGIVNREPYENGWLIDAYVDSNGLKWLLSDEQAGKWMEIEVERLHSIIRQDIGTTMTDGGIIIESLSSVIDEDEWNLLVKAFLCSMGKY